MTACNEVVESPANNGIIEHANIDVNYTDCITYSLKPDNLPLVKFLFNLKAF